VDDLSKGAQSGHPEHGTQAGRGSQPNPDHMMHGGKETQLKA
jgi:hypothetical protein